MALLRAYYDVIRVSQWEDCRQMSVSIILMSHDLSQPIRIGSLDQKSTNRRMRYSQKVLTPEWIWNFQVLCWICVSQMLLLNTIYLTFMPNFFISLGPRGLKTAIFEKIEVKKFIFEKVFQLNIYIQRLQNPSCVNSKCTFQFYDTPYCILQCKIHLL